MPSLRRFIVCESISTDSATGRISDFLVFGERLPIREFPWTLPRVVVAMSWKFDPEDADRSSDLRLKITPPDEAEADVVRSNLPHDEEGAFVVFTILGIPLSSAGRLKFEVFLGEDERAVDELVVEVVGTD